MNSPQGWTDDLRIPLPEDRTVGEVVDLIIQNTLASVPAEVTTGQLQEQFRLTEDDIALAFDRTFGGIVRAGTGIHSNRPDPVKDPIAWISYTRAMDDPSIPYRLDRLRGRKTLSWSLRVKNWLARFISPYS